MSVSVLSDLEIILILAGRCKSDPPVSHIGNIKYAPPTQRCKNSPTSAEVPPAKHFTILKDKFFKTRLAVILVHLKLLRHPLG